jgi:hypothetical protein
MAGDDDDTLLSVDTGTIVGIESPLVNGHILWVIFAPQQYNCSYIWDP